MTPEIDRPEENIFGMNSRAYERRYDARNLNHSFMVATAGRRRESLDGAWHFAVDPYDTGLRADWYQPPPVDSSGRRLPWDYDPLGGLAMTVPSCWNLARPEFFLYEGSAWYSRIYRHRPGPAGERTLLRIGAANYDTKVFLNGEFLGSHCGGSTPFFADLTPHLERKNLLQVCVNNTRRPDRIPMENTDWFNYGGIYREVDVIRLPEAHIRDFRIWLVPDGRFREIAGVVEVSGGASGNLVRLRLPGLGVETTTEVVDGRAEFRIAVAPELWSPDRPKLYEAQVIFGQDQLKDRVGFREIRAEGTEILLNKEPIFLRGVSVHEDDRRLGKSTSRADVLRRFRHARELGCNFLRLAHYPHHEMVAEMADEAGILLWEEVPVYWAVDFENPATYADAENQLRELIRRDFNRASVIIWSVGNENADTDARLNFMGKLAAAAAEEDSTRLRSAACLVNEKLRRLDDRLADRLDVIGMNEYYGWYRLNFGELEEILKNSAPGKPVIISEFGADALAGRGGKTLFAEGYMADVYRRQIELLRSVEYIRGMTPWILYDFRAPRRQNVYQQGYNRKGLIAADKHTRKRAFQVLQKFYREKAAEIRRTDRVP